MDEEDGLKLGYSIIDLFHDQAVRDNEIDVQSTLLVLTAVKKAMADEWVNKAKDSERAMLLGLLTQDLLDNREWLYDLLDRLGVKANE